MDLIFRQTGNEPENPRNQQGNPRVPCPTCRCVQEHEEKYCPVDRNESRMQMGQNPGGAEGTVSPAQTTGAVAYNCPVNSGCVDAAGNPWLTRTSPP